MSVGIAQLASMTLDEMRRSCQEKTCGFCAAFAKGGSGSCPFGDRHPAEWSFLDGEDTAKENLNKPEQEICRAVGARWVSRDACGAGAEYVDLWETMPKWSGESFVSSAIEDLVAVVRAERFPSVRPGSRMRADLSGQESAEQMARKF